MLHQGHLRVSSPHKAIVPWMGIQDTHADALDCARKEGRCVLYSFSQLWVEGEQPTLGLLSVAAEARYNTSRSQAVEFEANPSLGKRRLSTVCRRSCSNTKACQEREAEGPSSPSYVREEGLHSQVVNLIHLRTCITIIPKPLKRRPPGWATHTQAFEGGRKAVFIRNKSDAAKEGLWKTESNKPFLQSYSVQSSCEGVLGPTF